MRKRLRFLSNRVRRPSSLCLTPMSSRLIQSRLMRTVFGVDRSLGLVTFVLLGASRTSRREAPLLRTALRLQVRLEPPVSDELRHAHAPHRSRVREVVDRRERTILGLAAELRARE